MSARRSAAVILAVLPLLVFMSAEEGAKTSATIDFIGKAVNFLILFGGLAFVLRKPVVAMLAKRSADVQETLRLADASTADAAAKRAESEARLSGLEDEIRRMMGTAEAVAQREKERIAGLAAEEAQRLRRFTEQAIDEQVRSGLRELRAHAAETAT
ncbi:MAG TPA: ATP synthase F0 subunit B, partial [Burkholderiales bacterium]|nr:ATP synthase F0 subunit B [Burkholderiales bacterium]